MRGPRVGEKDDGEDGSVHGSSPFGNNVEPADTRSLESIRVSILYDRIRRKPRPGRASKTYCEIETDRISLSKATYRQIVCCQKAGVAHWFSCIASSITPARATQGRGWAIERPHGVPASPHISQGNGKPSANGCKAERE